MIDTYFSRPTSDSVPKDPPQITQITQMATKCLKPRRQSGICKGSGFEAIAIGVICGQVSAWAPDRVEPMLRPYKQALANQRRRRLGHVVQFIHAQ